MVMKMKKTLLIIFSAIFIGGVGAFCLFNKVVKESPQNTSFTASAFQIGAFSNYDNALRVANRNNGIVVMDEDIYRVFVAILKDQEAINKLKSYYKEIGLNYYLKQINVSKEYIDNISDVEELLKKSSSETYVVLNSEMLHIYEGML